MVFVGWLIGNVSVFCTAVAAGLSSAVAGGVAGSVVAVFVILIIAAVCYWRSEQFFFSFLFLSFKKNILYVVSHDGYIRVNRMRERQADRQTNRQRDRDRERQRERERETERER